MAGKPGNRIVVEAERVGQAERTGEILEVVESDVSVRYRVRWSDGRETLLTPAGGSVRIIPSADAPTASAEHTAEADGRSSRRRKGSSSEGGARKGNKDKARKGKSQKAQTAGGSKADKGKADKKRGKGSGGKRGGSRGGDSR